MKKEIPKYTINAFSDKKTKYCIGIPILNEGERIKKQLKKMYELGLHKKADIIIFDGGSNDGATNDEFLRSIKIRTLLVKIGSGKQGAQFRMGFDYILKEGYKGVITIDGNNKDSTENIPDFIKELENGYDFIQGSRFIKGGYHENTPFLRWLSVRFIHAPWISFLSKFWWTDTTSAYRGMSRQVLEDKRLNIFRNVFNAYELLFYMSARIPRLGYKVKETPVSRIYPLKEKIPTKIKWGGNLNIIWELIKITFGVYDVKK